MADAKAHLNGAYYGPSIPPQRSYHRPGRGGGDCGCLGCCGCCILNLVLKLVITAAVLVGLAILIFWLIFRPNKVKFHVVDASLTQFNHDSNNTLYYNLGLNMTIRNPNKRIGIYYDRIEARAYYEDQRFATDLVDPFYQGHKKTNTINPVFQGQNLVMLESEEASQFNSEKSTGIYSIDVKLYLRIRFKFGAFKTGKFKPKIKCDLKVPLNSNGTSSGSFQTTRCDVDF